MKFSKIFTYLEFKVEHPLIRSFAIIFLYFDIKLWRTAGKFHSRKRFYKLCGQESNQSQ